MTSKAAVLEKRTVEAITYWFDCSADLEAGETIASITSVTATGTGLTIGATAINASEKTFVDGRVAAIGKAASVVLSAGTAGTTYLLACKYVTSSGNTRVANGYLRVNDTPTAVSA